MQQISRCPGCGADNAYGQKFCGTCGTPLASGCPNCGSEIDPGSRFCGNCGAQLPSDAVATTNDAPPPGWVPPPPSQQPAGWGQQQQGTPQPGWNQQPAPPQQSAWSQQQQPVPQHSGWGQTPAGPQASGWGGNHPPAWGQQSGPWRQPSPGGGTSSMGTILVVILVVLLGGLGVFGYYAFFSDSPPWAGITSTSTTISVESGPFVTPVADETSENFSMEITWETDKLSVGRIEYGSDEGYGSMTDWETDYKKSHGITLSDLPADTSYHYRLIMKGQKGSEVTSADRSFKTPAPPED